MIALPQEMPLVRWNQGTQVPLSEGWLAESIDYSAMRAGYEEWGWTPEIAKAVAYYLSQEYPGTLITMGEVEDILQKAVLGIGYPEVAGAIAMVAPRVRIYLPDLARDAELELFFFKRLRDKLEDALNVVVRGVKLEGIRPCVKMIRGARKWHKYCDVLNDDIILFTRKHLYQCKNPPLELVIS